MVVLIRKDDKKIGARVVLWVIIISIIVIALILLWVYLIGPWVSNLFVNGDEIPEVECVTAPNIPSGISASVTGNSADVTWGATQNTDSYILYLSRVNGFNPAIAERTIEVIGPGTTVVNLLPVTYYFRVSSKNSCGQSNPSAQTSATITEWADKIKVCKRDTSTMCLFIPDTITQSARVSVACPGNECDINYDPLGDNQLSLYPGGAYCIEDNPGTGTPIQEIVTSESCASIPQQEWTIDLDTGRIESGSGFCLGADTVAESFVYNTSCASILSGDSRYEWVVQPI